MSAMTPRENPPHMPFYAASRLRLLESNMLAIYSLATLLEDLCEEGELNGFNVGAYATAIVKLSNGTTEIVEEALDPYFLEKAAAHHKIDEEISKRNSKRVG